MAYSDNGGGSWSSPDAVNDDQSINDGYSQAQRPAPASSTQITGRTQFKPGAHRRPGDGDCGPVVGARRQRRRRQCPRRHLHHHQHRRWYRLRRCQTYANPPKTAVDAITGQTNIIGPQPDNQSGGNPQDYTLFGYGTQMGLAAFGGQVYPVWAGDFNQSFYNLATSSVIADPLNIWYRPMVIAAGPRIVSSSMGPIPLVRGCQRVGQHLRHV